MLLRGNLGDFSLPNIFQLVDLSAKSGALTIRRPHEWGKIYFRRGSIYYAFTMPQQLPLGARLIGCGAVTSTELELALEEQQREMSAGDGARIGAILLAEGVIDRATLEDAVREQIQDAAFDFFGWPDGEFEFGIDEEVTDEDILVEMSVESVIMEGCRRIDEWERFVERVGSMESIPRLTWGPALSALDEIVLTPDEWRAIACINGRGNIATVLQAAGLDRFRAASVLHGLHTRGLVSVSDVAASEGGGTPSVVVRGSIDIYSEVFLSTLTDSDVTTQTRAELVDEKEVEVAVLTGRVTLELDGGKQELLARTLPAAAPEAAWARVAADSSGWIVLANANDVDSLRSTRRDLQLIAQLGPTPLVVASYLSMAGEELSEGDVRAVLGLGPDVPIVACHLRDRESVVDVARRVLALAGL